MAQAILLTGRDRRRRWSADDRLEILGAAFAPGANVSEVARRFDVSIGLIYMQRHQAMAVAVTDAPLRSCRRRWWCGDHRCGLCERYQGGDCVRGML
ncbi:transposase [Rhizobium sp. SL42]|uniref:transposase n=1 Tax=Rhizobium sp. SL42 TaxID=2806346 RepID=UPI003FA75968|nr:transposase [Rhizobium sp. SL42]